MIRSRCCRHPASSAGTLTLAPQSGLNEDTTTYSNLVSATDTLRGAFGLSNSTSPFFDVHLVPEGNSFGAEMTRIPFNALPGLTPNQQAIGNALEQGYDAALASPSANPAATTLYSNLLAVSAPDVGGAPGFFDSLSGQGLTGSQQTTFMANSNFIEAIRQQGAFWLTGEGSDVDGRHEWRPGASRCLACLDNGNQQRRPSRRRCIARRATALYGKLGRGDGPRLRGLPQHPGGGGLRGLGLGVLGSESRDLGLGHRAPGRPLRAGPLGRPLCGGHLRLRPLLGRYDARRRSVQPTAATTAASSTDGRWPATASIPGGSM